MWVADELAAAETRASLEHQVRVEVTPDGV
jgi:hypothetical protein